jgi:hypothetical protein
MLRALLAMFTALACFASTAQAGPATGSWKGTLRFERIAGFVSPEQSQRFHVLIRIRADGRYVAHLGTSPVRRGRLTRRRLHALRLAWSAAHRQAAAGPVVADGGEERTGADGRQYRWLGGQKVPSSQRRLKNRLDELAALLRARLNQKGRHGARS